MKKTGFRQKSEREQQIDAELGLIIDEMGKAMWDADKEYIAKSESPLTINMNAALCKFQNYCARYHGEKA